MFLYKIESLRASQSDKTWSFKPYNKNCIEGKNPITFQVKGTVEVHARMIGDAMLNYFNNPHSINDIDNTYSGALYIPRPESFEVIDAVFFDPVKKFISPIQITRKIQTHKKSDIKFNNLLKGKKHNVSPLIPNRYQPKNKKNSFQQIYKSTIVGPEDCGGYECTGLNNMIVRDLDGSFT